MATLAKTGISDIDEQHSVMEDCLSDLRRLLDGPCDSNTLLGSLEALSSYAEWHFTFEERLLERNKYPNRLEHIAEHRAIIGQLNSMRRKIGAGSKDVASLVSIISHWIVDHINHEDLKSAHFLANRQAGTPHHERPAGGIPLTHPL